MSQLDKQMEQAHEVDEPKVVLNGTTYLVSDMDERSAYLYAVSYTHLTLPTKA